MHVGVTCQFILLRKFKKKNNISRLSSDIRSFFFCSISKFLYIYSTISRGTATDVPPALLQDLHHGVLCGFIFTRLSVTQTTKCRRDEWRNGKDKPKSWRN